MPYYPPPSSGGVSDGDKGDITVSGGGTSWAIDANSVAISTDVSGLGAGVATFLATPSSANLKTAVTDETGTGGALVFATAPTLANVTLSAGTAAAGTAPLYFTSGTNLTSAAAGAIEYDGSLFYKSNVASQRGLSPSVLFTHCGSDYTLSAASGVQSAFAAAQDTLTLEGSSTYLFEAQYIMNTGATTHTTAVAFGGTATVNSCEYLALLWSAAANTISTTQSTTHVTGVASKVLNATSTAVWTLIQLKGAISINAGGTIIPQINFSANPTGTNLMKRGSYIKFTKIGGAAPTSIGNWS